MPKRPEASNVQLKVRMKEPLRAALEHAAERRGVSMNAEAVSRLERSFHEERAFGGPEMRRVVMLIATAFSNAGQLHAGGKSDWIDDPSCYRRGVVGALAALLFNLPEATTEDIKLEIEWLKGQLLTRMVQERMAEQDR